MSAKNYLVTGMHVSLTHASRVIDWWIYGWQSVEYAAAVLASQAEAIIRSLTNMAAADSNGYLKSNYILNINNRGTKHYTYSYIHAQTFTKTEPVSLSNPTMQPRLLVKPVNGFKGFCCSNWT